MRSQTTDCSKKLSNTLQPSPPIALEMLRQAIAAHQSGKFADAERLYRRALEVELQTFLCTGHVWPP